MLRQNPLAIANAMAWCTQGCSSGLSSAEVLASTVAALAVLACHNESLSFVGLAQQVPLLSEVSKRVGNPPAWHRGLPGPSGPEPQKSPKRVRKGVPGPPAPGSPRVPKECAPESEKSPKTQLRTLFRLFSDSGAHSLGTLGLRPRDTLPDCFRTLLGFRARRAREPSVPGGGVPKKRGWREGVGDKKGAKTQRKLIPRIVFHFSLGGNRKKGTEKSSESRHLAPTPSARQPLFETSDFGRLTMCSCNAQFWGNDCDPARLLDRGFRASGPK